MSIRKAWQFHALNGEIAKAVFYYRREEDATDMRNSEIEGLVKDYVQRKSKKQAS